MKDAKGKCDAKTRNAYYEIIGSPDEFTRGTDTSVVLGAYAELSIMHEEILASTELSPERREAISGEMSATMLNG